MSTVQQAVQLLKYSYYRVTTAGYSRTRHRNRNRHWYWCRHRYPVVICAPPRADLEILTLGQRSPVTIMSELSVSETAAD